MLHDFRLDSPASRHSTGVVYFSSARLGLELQGHGGAVFWPAAGVSAGTLIDEVLPYSLGAETRFVLGEDTLFCRISLPLTTNNTSEVAA